MNLAALPETPSLRLAAKCKLSFRLESGSLGLVRRRKVGTAGGTLILFSHEGDDSSDPIISQWLDHRDCKPRPNSSLHIGVRLRS